MIVDVTNCDVMSEYSVMHFSACTVLRHLPVRLCSIQLLFIAKYLHRLEMYEPWIVYNWINHQPSGATCKYIGADGKRFMMLLDMFQLCQDPPLHTSNHNATCLVLVRALLLAYWIPRHWAWFIHGKYNFSVVSWFGISKECQDLAAGCSGKYALGDLAPWMCLEEMATGIMSQRNFKSTHDVSCSRGRSETVPYRVIGGGHCLNLVSSWPNYRWNEVCRPLPEHFGWNT